MDISEYFSLILYIIGILGICFSILLVGFKIHKKNKLLSIFTLLIIFLSLISLASGTIFRLMDKKDSANAITVDSNKSSAKEQDNKKETSDKENSLTLDYKLTDSQAFITIKNISDSIFNGEVNLNFFDKNNNSIGKKTIPVKNLLPNTNTDCTLPVDNANKLTYTFSGQFDNKKAADVMYSIKSIGIGNKYFRFDVIPTSKDDNTINKICNEFKSTYNKSLCSGFLIYFVDENSKFNDCYAEYYCDYENNVIKLTKY